MHKVERVLTVMLLILSCGCGQTEGTKSSQSHYVGMPASLSDLLGSVAFDENSPLLSSSIDLSKRNARQERKIRVVHMFSFESSNSTLWFVEVESKNDLHYLFLLISEDLKLHDWKRFDRNLGNNCIVNARIVDCNDKVLTEQIVWGEVQIVMKVNIHDPTRESLEIRKFQRVRGSDVQQGEMGE